MNQILKEQALQVPGKTATASQWINWHKAMKKLHLGGTITVNGLFLEAWNKRGCAGVTCSANTQELREYCQKEGFTIEGGYLDFIPDTLDDVSDFTTKAFNLGFYTLMAIVVILIGFLGLLAWNMGRNPKMVIETAGAVAAARSGGKL